MKYLLLLCLLFIGCSKAIVIENQKTTYMIDTVYNYTYKIKELNGSSSHIQILTSSKKYAIGDTVCLDDGSF